MSWRIDVELGQRNMSTKTTPMYMLRLDTVSVPDEKVQSIHIQSDYANMKHLQRELQLALDELSGVHCQRITRYIT